MRKARDYVPPLQSFRVSFVGKVPAAYDVLIGEVANLAGKSSDCSNSYGQ